MSIDRTQLSNLYLNKHFSAKEISKLLHCSENKVWYWLSKFQIPIRNRSDANYYKYNANGDPFQIKSNLTPQESNLLYLSLGFFWGEGNKKSVTGVRIANSDPNLLIWWCKFLRTVCNVREDKIHFHLQIFKDNNPDSAKVYWSKQLNIDVDRIHVGTPTKPLGNGTYKNISLYGVMTIGVYNVKFLKWMLEQLRNLGYNS